MNYDKAYVEGFVLMWVYNENEQTTKKAPEKISAVK